MHRLMHSPKSLASTENYKYKHLFLDFLRVIFGWKDFEIAKIRPIDNFRVFENRGIE